MIQYDFPVIHDWVVRFGGWPYGIQEWDYGSFTQEHPAVKPTKIFVGMHWFQSSYPAYAWLAAAVIAIILLVAVSSFVISRMRRS